MEYVLKCSKLCFALTRKQVKELAYTFAKKNGISYPPTWDKKSAAGKDWFTAFMRRHPNLSIRTSGHISLNRAKSFCKKNVDAFFQNLISVIGEFDAKDIWNADETGFPTVPTKDLKVVAEKGAKHVGKMSSQERGTNVTMVLAVNAVGDQIPPFLIFPRKIMRAHYMNGATHGAVGVSNDSGWMTNEFFVEYMKHFIKHTNASKASPKLLLLDNHSTHITIEVIDLAIEHGITMVSFPPHTSHRLQPLDVSVFGPVKSYYDDTVETWMTNHGGQLFEIHHVAALIDESLEKRATKTNIKSGFEKSGIFPLKPGKLRKFHRQ